MRSAVFAPGGFGANEHWYIGRPWFSLTMRRRYIDLNRSSGRNRDSGDFPVDSRPPVAAGSTMHSARIIQGSVNKIQRRKKEVGRDQGSRRGARSKATIYGRRRGHARADYLQPGSGNGPRQGHLRPGDRLGCKLHCQGQKAKGAGQDHKQPGQPAGSSQYMRADRGDEEGTRVYRPSTTRERRRAPPKPEHPTSV